MIKGLKRVIGIIVREGRTPGQGVIGRVDKSTNGYSIIETGRLNPDLSWTKNTESGHIALEPGEREELIAALESHRNAPLYKVGDVIGGPLMAGVLAVQYHDGGGSNRPTGTVLAYSVTKREYWVWSVNADGELGNGNWTYDLDSALNRYAARLAGRLYTHFNLTAPKLTFRPVPDADTLKD